MRPIKQQWCEHLHWTWETTTSSMLVRAFARRHGHTDDMFIPVRSSLLSVGDFMSTLKKSNSWDVYAKDNHYHHCIVATTRGPLLSPLLWPWRASPSLWHLWLLCFASRRCLLWPEQKITRPSFKCTLSTLYCVKIFIFPPISPTEVVVLLSIYQMLIFNKEPFAFQSSSSHPYIAQSGFSA